MAGAEKVRAASGTPPVPRRPLVRWLRAVAALGLLALLLVLFHAPLLSAAARWWVVDDANEKADAVVVLGGGAQYRTFEAARLYHAGRAPKVAFMNVRPDPDDPLHLTSNETEIVRRLLIHEGVPEADLALVGDGVTSTSDEAKAMREWAVKNSVKRLVIPTDIFHTRRVSWYFRKTFRGTGIEVRVDAMRFPEYDTGNWWRDERGLIAFQNEVVKFLLYVVKR
ncbi:MAG: YdcF family protein [Verrucomicrobia bacterium]|nr:YdcF family protein [Verrucomicrobiota bacterium]